MHHMCTDAREGRDDGPALSCAGIHPQSAAVGTVQAALLSKAEAGQKCWFNCNRLDEGVIGCSGYCVRSWSRTEELVTLTPRIGIQQFSLRLLRCINRKREPKHSLRNHQGINTSPPAAIMSRDRLRIAFFLQHWCHGVTLQAFGSAIPRSMTIPCCHGMGGCALLCWRQQLVT